MGFDTEACGARIRELRKGNKLTQEKLAEELNITDSHLRRIENGTGTVPPYDKGNDDTFHGSASFHLQKYAECVQ